jgi:hypothetical protein
MSNRNTVLEYIQHRLKQRKKLFKKRIIITTTTITLTIIGVILWLI